MGLIIPGILIRGGDRMGRTLSIGAVQLFSRPREVGENLERATTYFELLAEKGVDAVVFPEMFNSGYGVDPEILRIADETFDETVETLGALADEREILIVAGIARREQETWFNSTIVVRPYVGPVFYDKTHLFRDEKKAFTPGKSFLSFEYREVNFGVLMCFEIGFPEISRRLCHEGAEVLLVPFAFGKERTGIYTAAISARSIENGVFLVASSQPGKPGPIEFVGCSRVVHPSGRVLADAGSAEGFIIAELDVDQVKRYRYHEGGDSNGYFSNLRPELYLK